VLTEDIMDTQQRLQYTASTQALFSAAATAGADLSGGTGNQPYTVFAPRNAAFSDVNLENVAGGDEAQPVPGLAGSIVNYHVIPGQELTSGDLPAPGQSTTVTTAEGSDLTIQVGDEGGVILNPSTDAIPVTVTDVNTTNGIVHYVDAAPLQSNLTITERTQAYSPLATLSAAAAISGRAGVLDDENGTFTLFAPTQSAFGSLPGDVLGSLVATEQPEAEPELLGEILDYHVFTDDSLSAQNLAARVENEDTLLTTRQGQDVVLGTSEGGAITVRPPEGTPIAIDSADIATSNGFVHTIDGAPLIPTVDAVETGVLNGFLSFRTATQVTDLRGTISGEDPISGVDPITVFAPTDAAFTAYLEDIGAPSLTRLNQSEEDELAETLQYHAVDQELTAEDIRTEIDNSMDGTYTVQTLEGSDLEFTLREDGAILVNGEPLTTADLEATNGVVHGVGTVLSIPQSN